MLFNEMYIVIMRVILRKYININGGFEGRYEKMRNIFGLVICDYVWEFVLLFVKY